jgi:hypothetical protein
MSRAQVIDRPDPPLGMVPLLLATAVAAVVWGVGSLFVPAHAADAAAATTTKSSAAPTAADAEARYQRDKARCLAGQSQEDSKTCLREAGAALQAAREHDLRNPGAAQLAANARARCNVFKTDDDRKACLARVSGDATVSGSVAAGGVLRQYTEVIPPPESMPPTAAGPARPATATTPPAPAVLPPADSTAPPAATSPVPPAR